MNLGQLKELPVKNHLLDFQDLLQALDSQTIKLGQVVLNLDLEVRIPGVLNMGLTDNQEVIRMSLEDLMGVVLMWEVLFQEVLQEEK